MLPGAYGSIGSAGASSGSGSGSLLSIIQSLSLTSGLQLCLDAGDSASYSGSGQTWNDRSGGGYNFYLGADGSAGGTDPTFNGTPGALSSSNYWSYNGSQYFTLAQSNPTWVQNIHKAGAVFTIMVWAYANSITSTTQAYAVIGDNLNSSGATGTGFQFGASLRTVRALNLFVTNASSDIYDKDSVAVANNNAWNFLAVSANLSTGVVIFNINGTSDTFTSQAYPSPSSAGSLSTLQISALGGGYASETSGDRVAEAAMWGGTALSSANLISLYNATRTRFGV